MSGKQLVASVRSRRSHVLGALSRDGTVSVAELAAELGVSGMTIRRDLAALERAGDLRRVRGGAAIIRARSDHPGMGDAHDADHRGSSDAPDVLILNPMEPRMARMIIQEYSPRTPIIAESIPFPGITTLIAIDSYQAGASLGEWVARYVVEQMHDTARVLFVGLPSFSDTAERARGFFDGLNRTDHPAFAMTIDGRGVRQQSYQVALAALSIHPDINVIIGVNDQATLGAMDAVRELRISVENVLLGTFGLEGMAGKQLLMRECPRSVGVAMFPEFIGRVCADVAIKAHNRVPLPAQVVTPTAVVTRDTLPDYYSFERGRPCIQWDAVSKILFRGQKLPQGAWTLEAALLVPDSALLYPKRVDFVRYLHDEYYDQLIEGLRERAAEFDIAVRVTDASADLAASLDSVRRAIGKAAAALVKAGEAVILDAGTTNTYLAQQLARRRDEKFTVITNSIPVIEALKDAEHITLIGIGGILHRPSQSFLGVGAEDAIGALRADKLFLGGSGVSVEHGISNLFLAEAEFKRRMLRAAKEVILVADSYKIGEISLVKIAPISAIRKLVTDDQISSRDRLALTQAGVEVLLAPNGP
jgi:DeoR family fructose operon transcriptional repressor